MINKMPLLFARAETRLSCEIERFIVIIASPWDYVSYNSSWMDNPELPEGRTYRPDVDIRNEQHLFDDEQSALDFIEKWWIKEAVRRSQDCEG